jgi:hypothetical protein
VGVFCVDNEVISSICKTLRNAWNSTQLCSIMMGFESQTMSNRKRENFSQCFLQIIVSCTKTHRTSVYGKK